MNRKERRRLEKAARTGRTPSEMTIPEALDRAISLYEGGYLRESLRICRNLLAMTPGDPDLLHLAGTIAAQMNDAAQARELLEAAIAADPGRADAHYNLANAYRVQGRPADAIAAYRRAVEIDPRFAEAYNNLGIVLLAGGDAEAAEAAHARSIELRPDNAGAQCNLAIALHHTGRTRDAEAACRRAIALAPDMAEAHNALGNILKFQGRTEEALAAYGRAIEANPTYGEAHNNLGVLYHEQRHLDRAIAASRRAIELMPTLMDAYKNLGYSLQQQGRHDEALLVYDRALAFGDDAGIAVRKALVLPLVPESLDAIAEARARMESDLAALESAGVTLADPAREVAVTNFFLAYHGLDDRPLQERLARFYLAACPSLAWTAPHLADGKFAPAPGERIRVGFVSRYLVAGHTIGKLFGGAIGRLPRERFETVIFRPTAVTDSLDAAAERVVALSDSLRAAREQIAAEKPHVLVYLDIGMEPLSYFLAFSRLAPVQCVTFGHPVTTGIPTLDHFLSTADLDPDGAEAHYSEPLARLSRLPVFYRRPEVPAEGLPGRHELGLPEDKHLYVCTQTLFKLHPDFDAALAAILERDPDGIAVFIGGPHAHMVALLRRRLEKAIPDADARLVFLPALGFAEFLGLSATADVLLDSLHFSGGNTSLEALALGTPIVTWPSGFMRGRFTYAVYRQMGVDDLIARDPAHYVELALRAATDADWRAEVGARIRAAGDAFFEDPKAVDALAEFLVGAVA